MADRTGVERTRRRFARRQWARRWLTWRYVLGVLLVVAVAGFAAYAVYLSPWLRVEGAEVVGEAQLTEDQVLAAAEVPQGGALARVDLDAIARRVQALPAVRSVDVSRQWPHDVRIEVVEREPVAVVDDGDGYSQLDAEGWTFGRLAKVPDGLPLVEIGSDADRAALVEAAEVVAALDPAVSARVEAVEVGTVDQVVLRLHDGREVQWGSAEQAEEKAAVLLDLLEAVPDARTYDVSVPGLPTTTGP